MKTYKYIALMIAGLSITTLAARAATIDLTFNFEDPNGIVTGEASLTATPVFDDPGAYLATAGTLDIKAPQADGITGDYTLFQNPFASSAAYSPTGLFIYDDLVMPGGSPVVTNPGFLGVGGPGTGSVPEGKGSEINFFSNGANTYDLYTGANGNYPYSYQFTVGQPGGSVFPATVTATLVKADPAIGRDLIAAPEPATWLIMGSFLLLALGGSRFREAATE
jgi:hypothetical protein